MRPPTPKLQYRLAATLAACSAVLFSAPAFAHTEDSLTAPAPAGPDGSNVTLGSGGGGQFPFALGSYNGLVLEDSADEGVDASLDPIRRARRAVSSVGNNQYQEDDIKPGEAQKWYFPRDAKDRDGDGPKDGNDREGGGPKEGKDKEGDTPKEERPSHQKRANTVYVSMTICSKPRLSKGAPDHNPPALPQLEVSILGLNGTDSWAVFKSEGGYMSAVGDATGDVQLKVTAPESKDYEGTYHYQIAASVDALFHTVGDDESLFPVDSDTTTALLATADLNKTGYHLPAGNDSDWLHKHPPFVMFANNVNDPSIEGMERSYCALNLHAQVKGKKSVEASMTRRPGGEKLREQFYVTKLNRSSEYTGILAMAGDSTDSGNGYIGGGGRVWKPETFSTKNDDNCALIHDLPFCNEVAYSVPTNPQNYKNKLPDLITTYDDHARSLYKNFTYSLAQIQCNATNNETKWSLSVNCDDCANAYKNWLCAVTIPRCVDFSNTNNTALYPRNILRPFHNGTSLPSSAVNDTIRKSPAARHARNPWIDRLIKPGPYKEMLPCRDLCWDLVRSCPSALDFSCPEEPEIWASYGAKNDSEEGRCNYPEAPFRNKNGGVALRGGVGFGLGGCFGLLCLGCCDD
ncbi:hypothetical protein P168DRAFT_325739 [Aspergillus campestris IBT 28561]|uniref:Cora family metal ion transporter n=1 Tax=Aspergillus campestris (strain IBT 28561) TaxID=1392248 RepID=A0A2I1D677_ASPC2|nr:uncharacterized protein P168DRAFT_325739 [Aspergillus campestris IBT 28561]PKY05380.1 hypothetical protein P168DRAFT_325739 [Aspergillus campestris IBT 28561]